MAELKKKDEIFSFATNQQVDHLDMFFDKKMMELEERLTKNWEKKVKNIVEDNAAMINQPDQKVSNIENLLSMSSSNNAQKLLD